MARALLLLAAASAIATTSAAGSRAAVAWFHSPSKNIECEVAASRPALGTYAFCATLHPARCVRLTAGGRMTIRRGAPCLGNEPDNAFTLAYGRAIRIGPFRCTSRTDGIRCVVSATGRGFLINRAGVTRL